MTEGMEKPLDVGPFSMMAVAAMEGSLHTIELAGKKYPAMQYQFENPTPLLCFGRGLIRHDKHGVMRLWAGLSAHETVNPGDWVVMLSRSAYTVFRLTQSESLFSLMPNVVRSTPEERLSRIAQQHSREVLDNGMTSGMCVECEHVWPCPTYVWATQDRDPLSTWDPADDENED